MHAPMNKPSHPTIIQGGMGAGVSAWPLALAVSRAGQLGVVSGTALDLVAHMETVNGKVKGERSDRQFRMYVKLKTDAIDTLNRCREFNREADNTVYHKGYPINYRQSGSIPSIPPAPSRRSRSFTSRGSPSRVFPSPTCSPVFVTRD